MQLLAENLERQVAAQVRKGLVVWLDKDGLYTEFVDQLAERRAQGLFFAPVLAHRGSFLELLINESPQDRWGVIQVEELVSAGRIAREIIPASHWTPLSDEGKELARSAANRVLLGSVHTGLKSEICQWSWSQEQTLLRSHLIDEQALDYLKASQFDSFLKHRAQMVRRTTDAFLRQQAAWNQPDIRPLRYYAESVESIA